MQKDIRSNKGETTNTKEGDKLRQVGHDVNASLKENVGVGVGNYSSTEDRQRSNMYQKSHDLKDQRENEFQQQSYQQQPQGFQQQSYQQPQGFQQSYQQQPQGFQQQSYQQPQSFQQQKDWKEGERREWKEGERKDWNEGERREWKEGEKKENNDDVTGAITHKVKEIGREINATLKQNVGIGLGNYSSEVDKELANEHKEKYEEKIQDTKKQVEETKQQLEEKKEEMKDKMYEGTTGKYTHRVTQIGHDVNAALKENIGIGVGDYPSEKDRELSKEHWENFQEKVKDEQKPEVVEGTTIGHKIKEVVHNLNANLKEMIGVGFGNYSSEVDRELATLHKEKYEEQIEEHQIDTNLKEDKDELKSDLREKKDEVKSDLREKKDEVKSDFREKKNEVKNDLREKKNDLKDKKL